MSILEDFHDFLDSHGRLSANQADAMIALIKKHSKWATLLDHGPCLICDDPIDYGSPSTVHKQRGDDWLLGTLFPAFDVEWGIEASRRDARIGVSLERLGYERKTIAPYTCEDCLEDIDERVAGAVAERQLAEQLKHRIRATSQRGTDLTDAEMAAILEGKTDTSINQRLKILKLVVNQDDIDYLRSLPYPEFLETTYWEIVRKAVYARQGYRCGLCSNNGKMHAHHKTYRNHGYEHENLDDLIALCEDCHRKHHEVLDE